MDAYGVRPPEQVLRTFDGVQGPFGCCAVSPDGSTVALGSSSGGEIHISLVALSGGADREITLEGWLSLTGLDWSADGRGLYLGYGAAHLGTLLYVDLKGNATVLWQYKGGGTSGQPSPDGRYLAINGVAFNSNVWMVEGL